MKSETPLDYAIFQLSPKHSRCELFVAGEGTTEKLASGLVKPFVAHLKVAEEQVARSVQSIKLEVGTHKNAGKWFTKGTLERFVRFVSTPEVLDLVNTLDAEMSQLEAARKIYSQGSGDQLSCALDMLILPIPLYRDRYCYVTRYRDLKPCLGGTVHARNIRGGRRSGVMAASDATKKELLRAIDLRLVAVKQDLATACTRAAAAGFNSDTISELRLFADQFGASRLSEACSKFISLCEGRAELINPWKTGVDDDQAVRASYGSSDMSIDEDPTTPDNSWSHQTQAQQRPHDDKRPEHHIEHQPKPSSSAFPSRHGQESCVKNEDRGKEEKSSAEKESPQAQAPQPARRLSVQDRINLFENKQKETSTSGSGGVVKPAVGKSAELRRLSSDVSSAPAAVEKAVLRRWSGVSDMSIDFSGERKETGQSPLFSPSSPSASPTICDDRKGLNNDGGIAPCSKPEVIIQAHSGVPMGVSPGGRNSDVHLTVSSGGSEHVAESKKLTSTSSTVEYDGLKNRLKDQTNSQTKVNSLPNISVVSDTSQPSDTESRDQPVSVSNFMASLNTAVESVQLEGGSGSKIREAFAVYKGTESESRWRSSGEASLPLKSSGNSTVKYEDSELQKTIGTKQDSPSEKMKSQGRKDEISTVYGSRMNQDYEISAVATEQVQRVRQSKVNKELNDELKMKADELEKLFAEHKLRLPGDQSNSTKKNKPAGNQNEQAASLPYWKPVAEVAPAELPDKNMFVGPSWSSSNAAKSNTSSSKETVDNHDHNEAHNHNLSDLAFSEDSRGKFYEKYMEKRDAKLREEWATKRAEKEAKMKAMHDSFETSRAEMNAKLSGSVDGKHSVLLTRLQAERLRSFNTRSSMKSEQKRLDFVDNEEEDEDMSFGETSFGDSVSRSTLGKKLLPNKSLSSSAPRNSALPVPKSGVKASNSSLARRRMQPENPLTQSVPNFSDLRKENTKPSPAAGKIGSRPQLRNYARSKSTSEDVSIVKEEKANRSESLRKSTVSPAEVRELFPMSSEAVALTPLKFVKEQKEQALREKFSKNVESTYFLQMSNGMGSDAEAGVSMLNDEDSNESAFKPDDLADMVKDDKEELKIMTTEAHADLHREEPSWGQDADVMKSGTGIGDRLRSFSQVDPSFVAALPCSMPSSFHPVESLQDSPVESPVSWNSRIHHPFSYPHEASDIDASVDSPIGSPASWNSHSLNQAESDAARMRKKWGNAQKPNFGGNSSFIQSRKDVTKGFKRLLKFGRKNRGTDSMVDWISATTSEGDDDTEDGRDLANRSSEDLRKSRMGFLQGHPSDDSFNENEFFCEQVQDLNSSIPAPPANFKLRDDHLSGSSIKGASRSFFSLSSFRSKGSESKPR